MSIREEIEKRKKAIADRKEAAAVWAKMPGKGGDPLQIWPKDELEELIQEAVQMLKFDTPFLRWEGPDGKFRITYRRDLAEHVRAQLDAGEYKGNASFVMGTTITMNEGGEKSAPAWLIILSDGAVAVSVNGRFPTASDVGTYTAAFTVKKRLVEHLFDQTE